MDFMQWWWVLGIILPISAIGICLYRRWYYQTHVESQFVILGFGLSTFIFLYYVVATIAGIITILKFVGNLID
jgi:hypothetical protein